MGAAMDEAAMIADLTARLAALERQHADQLALLRAAMAIGQTEGRIAELRAILSGFDQGDHQTAGESVDANVHLHHADRPVAVA